MSVIRPLWTELNVCPWVGRCPSSSPGRCGGDRREAEAGPSPVWAVKPDTFDAEYVALTQLHADVLIALGRHLANAVQDLITVTPIEALCRA